MTRRVGSGSRLPRPGPGVSGGRAVAPGARRALGASVIAVVVAVPATVMAIAVAAMMAMAVPLVVATVPVVTVAEVGVAMPDPGVRTGSTVVGRCVREGTPEDLMPGAPDLVCSKPSQLELEGPLELVPRPSGAGGRQERHRNRPEGREPDSA